MVNLSVVRKIQEGKSLIFSVLFLVVFFVPNITLAFSNASINFDGIGEIAILAVENNVAAGSQSTRSGGRSASRSTFDLFIQIPIDEKFPELFLKCAVGGYISGATINFDHGLYSIKLKEIIIGSIEFSDVSEKEAMLSMGLFFGKIEWTYGDVTTGFDLQSNSSINID